MKKKSNKQRTFTSVMIEWEEKKITTTTSKAMHPMWTQQY